MSSIETKSWDAPKHAEESEEQKSTKETVEKKKKSYGDWRKTKQKYGQGVLKTVILQGNIKLLQIFLREI